MLNETQRGVISRDLREIGEAMLAAKASLDRSRQASTWNTLDRAHARLQSLAGYCAVISQGSASPLSDKPSTNPS
jgi:hypothetical protein